jgi:hypothetical protein
MRASRIDSLWTLSVFVVCVSLVSLCFGLDMYNILMYIGGGF